MTTRRWVISVAAATLVVGGFIGVDRLNRRAVRFGNMADYHRRMEQESDAKAAFFEGLANDPSKETDLPPALFDEGIWSRGQALEMELESTMNPLVAKASLMVAFRSAKGAHPLFPFAGADGCSSCETRPLASTSPVADTSTSRTLPRVFLPLNSLRRSPRCRHTWPGRDHLLIAS